MKRYVTFCNKYGYASVPATEETLCRYVAELAKKLTPQSIKQYLNVIRIVHLECGLENPLLDNWVLRTLLRGIKRVKGIQVKRKLPITIEILLSMYGVLNLQNSRLLTFWAACLVSFFGMMRKSSLFPRNLRARSQMTMQCCALHQWGMSIHSQYSKTIQYNERSV